MTDLDPDVWCESKELSDTLIIAPPGCGKTELLARRAAACIRSGTLPSGRRILALTFTNKARDNLASRLIDQVGRDYRRHVSVMNFHGLGMHLYSHHRYVLDDPVRSLLPDARSIRAIERLAFKEHHVPRGGESDIRVVVRQAKSGPYSDAEVLERLEEEGVAAALGYEHRLRAEGRLDHDDVLRFGLRILQHEGVAGLYSERFAYVLVDEAQDLTRVQYEMVEPIGSECTVFAGDLAQGIYTFAGADPTWVFDRIDSRKPLSVRLSKSYRSSPEVLAVVSALGGELGAPALTCADPARWAGRGRARVARFRNPRVEAQWLVEEMLRWRDAAAAEAPPRRISVGVLTRMKTGGRRDAFLKEASDRGIRVETWDHPLHRAEVVHLLRKHLDGALATVEEPVRQVEELYLRCFAEVPPENANTLIDLRDAVDELADLVKEDGLRALIERIRIRSDVDLPVGPGVHLLTGHTGKGQGFDKVVILGLEEGQIPSFFVRGLPEMDPEVREELALLHVMASRAKEELLITICENANGHSQRPSRWLPLIEEHLEQAP